MVDLTNSQVDKLKTYDGANGKKLSVIYNNERYMVKFNAAKKGVAFNSSISEHIACSIFNSLGVDAQKTFLANYTINNKNYLVVACKDFEQNGFLLRNFIGIANSCISTFNGSSLELSEILKAIQEQEIVSSEVVTARFWDMFICDALLGSFDRHNGNWGFLVNPATRETKLAPVFDCGSCLYPRLQDKDLANIISSKTEIEQRIKVFPTSAIKLNDKKICYQEFLEETDNKDCIKSLIKISERIDYSKIENIINSCPITNIRKEFYLTMIKQRQKQILQNALENNLSVKQLFAVGSTSKPPNFLM